MTRLIAVALICFALLACKKEEASAESDTAMTTTMTASDTVATSSSATAVGSSTSGNGPSVRSEHKGKARTKR